MIAFNAPLTVREFQVVVLEMQLRRIVIGG